MALLGFGKKKETEKKSPACACQCGCASSKNEPVSFQNVCCSKEKSEITSIRVLGTGCPSCHTLLENTQKAVKNMGLPVEPEYVTDLPKIMEYGVMSVPALMVNESVVSAGKVLKAHDIEKLLRTFGVSQENTHE